MIQLCDYGCGHPVVYQFKNGKWCCSKSWKLCPFQQKKKSTQMKEIWKNPNSKYNSNSCREKQSKANKKAHKDPNSKYNSNSYKEKRVIIMKEAWKDPNSRFNSNQLTINNMHQKYPFFSKIEEMRYNPDKPDEKEIQVHCKNHNCKNSKEKGGWFVPTKSQLSERMRQLENKDGNDGSYFYCSQECKNNCILFGLRSDPLNNTLPYTAIEIQTFNKFVLERENGLCEYCGEPAEHVHHIRPKKLEPFFALDPDFGVAVCKKCHYKYGHKNECSTGNLAKIVCSVESQNFLNQKI